MPKIRAVLFDLGDTLVDTEASAERAFEAFARSRDFPEGFKTAFRNAWWRIWTGLWTSGQDAPAEDFRRMVFETVLPATGLDPGLAAAWAADYGEAERRAWTLFPDVLPFLKEWAGKIPLGIVTNGLPSIQWERLEVTGLLGRFGAVEISRGAGYRKPGALIFVSACARLGVTTEEALVVGDNPRVDGEGALAAGLQAVWLNRTARYAASPLPETLGLITTLADLPAWISAVEGGEKPPKWWVSPGKSPGP